MERNTYQMSGFDELSTEVDTMDGHKVDVNLARCGKRGGAAWNQCMLYVIDSSLSVNLGPLEPDMLRHLATFLEEYAQRMEYVDEPPSSEGPG